MSSPAGSSSGRGGPIVTLVPLTSTSQPWGARAKSGNVPSGAIAMLYWQKSPLHVTVRLRVTQASGEAGGIPREDAFNVRDGSTAWRAIWIDVVAVSVFPFLERLAW